MRHGLLRATFVLLLAILAACRPMTRPPAAPASGPAAAGMAIRLAHAPARDAWELVYTLPRPLAKVQFLRSGYPNRIAKWHVTTPGLTIVREGDEDVVRAADGHAFTTFAIDIATYAQHPEKDYQVFVPYADGSSLVYTGSFDIGAPGDDDAAPRTHFTFVPRADERVLVGGEVAARARTWATSAQGTYVYFGSTTPVVGDGFVAVVDGAMPAWLRTPMESLLPAVFRLYASRTGVPLTFTPMVFLSYRPEEAGRGGFSVDGGTLPGLIQLEVRLDEAHQRGDDERVRDEVGRVLAHEVAHLWNAQMFHHDTHAADWMHEGGADAFAYEALRILGRIRPAHLREAEAEAFSSCLLATRLGPVRAANVPGRFKQFYWCGHLITHLTGDPFGSWGRLFRAAPGGAYAEEQLFAELRGKPNGAASENAARLLLTASGDPIAAVLAADPSLVLSAPGTPLSAAYDQLAGLVATTLVARSACGRDVAPQSNAGGYRLEGACGELGKDRIVAEIAGRDVRRAGVAAYDAAVLACSVRPTLAVGVRDDASATAKVTPIDLPCPRPLLPRPPHVTPRE